MSRTGHHEDCDRPNLFWSLQSTETQYQQIQRKKKKANL